jgi:NCS1 family nucleobase:cation symporter-1
MPLSETGVMSDRKNDQRLLTPKAYVAMWWGDAVMVGAFMLGSSLIPPFGELNLYQAATVLVVANVFAAIVLAVNGRAGWKHGIPMIIQLRSSFGLVGAWLPGLLRGVPALFWYGIQTWLGALAINSITIQLMGFDSVWIWFFSFQTLQIIISARGMKSIKWVEVAGAIFVMLGLVYLLFLFLNEFGVEVRAVADQGGSWALPFWLGITVMTGQFSAIFLNVSDYTRHIPRGSVSEKSYLNAHMLGVVPPSILVPLIGMIGTSAVGLWNPIDVISYYIPLPLVSVFILFFIALAQITTNLVANIIPPALIAMELFKIPWASGCIIIGLLAVFTCPWLIMTAEVFIAFINVVSAFLGPILGIMLVDYFIIHRGHYDVDALQQADMYEPWNKVNPAAIIACMVGASLAFVFQELSWFAGTLAGGGTYSVLMKYWIMRFDDYAVPGVCRT